MTLTRNARCVSASPGSTADDGSREGGHTTRALSQQLLLLLSLLSLPSAVELGHAVLSTTRCWWSMAATAVVTLCKGTEI